MSRVTSPTTGEIKTKGRIASLLEVGTGFHPEMTGRENIYLNGAILGMTKAEITEKLDEIIEFSGCQRYIDTPVKRYSSGMKVRLAFAVAAHLEPDILVVDEVLAVGDAEFQKKAIGKMQDISTGDGRTVLFVSHNMAAVKSLCTGFLNMMIALKDNDTVKRMVYAASSSTYGDSKSLPKVEDTIGKPLSPYAVTKYVNELYADVFGITYDTDVIGLRYFNVFGPKQSPDGAYAAVIPLFMQALKDNEPPKINGDGEQTRDFTFIDNVVQANVKGFFASKQAKNEVFNVACGERITINYLWESLRIAADSKLKATYGPPRQGDVRDSLANISKAENLLGYKPQFTVREGLKITWDYFN